MLTNPGYKISFVLDKTAMFTVVSSRKGKDFKHSVKPLPVIWSKVKCWSAANTVHIDDLSRNFSLNPANGIKVKAYYRERAAAEGEDVELRLLAVYLLSIADCPDMSKLDHSHWRRKVQGES